MRVLQAHSAYLAAISTIGELHRLMHVHLAKASDRPVMLRFVLSILPNITV